MADYNVSVTANGLVPAVIYTGTEGSVGKTIDFTFSEDWDGYTKEVIFFDTRGNVIVVPLVSAQDIPIPTEITMYGGPHKYTVRGFTLDSGLYIDDALQVTGTIVTSYTAGTNPRMEGRILPSTVDLFLYQANQEILNDLAQAKASGEFDGKDGASAGFGRPTALATSLPAGRQPQVSVAATGPDTAKQFTFVFGIPQADTIRDIPDGLTQQDGLVYLTVDGQTYGPGASVVGKNFTILGHYASLLTLQAAVPNPEVGDAYSVGELPPYDIYVFDGRTHQWANYGAIQDGGGGQSITVDDSIIANSTNPVQSKVIQEYVGDQIPTALKNPNALTIFGTAYDGSSAVTIPIDSSMSDSSTHAVQNKTIKGYIDDLIGDVDTAIAAINAVVGTPET